MPSSNLLFNELLQRPNLRLRIGEHVVDVGALRLITRPEHPRLTSKAVAVLIELVQHAGDTVTRDQLLDRVWAGRVTTPDVLTQAITDLRRAFADDERPPRYIETIPKVGYRLLATVAVLSSGDMPIIATEMQAANLENDAHRGVNRGSNPVQATVAPQSKLPRTLIVVAAIAVVLSLGFVFSGVRSRSSADAGASPWQVTSMRAITSDPGAERRPHISPDGTRLAYVKTDAGAQFSRIHMRAMQPSAVSNLTAQSDEYEGAPTWSPDGTQIAFERLGRDTCHIFVASSAGGAEREVGACQSYATNYFDWTPDGKHLITANRNVGVAGDLTLEQLDIVTGAKQPINYDHSVNDQDLEPRYSPDGKWIAFRRGIAPFSNLCVMSASGGAVRQLTHVSTRIRGYTWTRDGSALIFASNLRGAYELFAIGIADGSVHPLGVRPAEYPDAARADQTIVYEIPRANSALAEVSVGGDGKPTLLAASTGSDGAPALSPEGNRIAFVSDRSGSQQLWLYDAVARTASPLTDYQDTVLLNPNWGLNGKQLLVTARHGDSASLVEIDLASHRQRVISKPQEHILSGNYGPEANSYLVMSGASSPSDSLVYLRNVGTPNETSTTLAAGVAHIELDQDARLVYYTKTAQRGLFRRDLDGGAEQFVTPLITSILLDGWRVVGGKIWYVSDMEFNPTDIREIDPVNQQERTIGTFKVALVDINFSVNAAHDRIIIVPVGSEDTDVGAFELTPSARQQSRAQM